MSYRNDHDAALHRVDALEAELTRLRKEHETIRATRAVPDQPARKSARFVVALVAVIVVGTIALFRVESRAGEPAVPIAVPTSKPVDGPRDWIRPCLKAIEKLRIQLDMSNTDPRGSSRESVTSIINTGANCRSTLAAFAKSTDQAFGVWSAAEDQLAGAITRIQVYYASDPYALDNYATAYQLWSEYNAAIVMRDHALQVLQL